MMLTLQSIEGRLVLLYVLGHGGGRPPQVLQQELARMVAALSESNEHLDSAYAALTCCCDGLQRMQRHLSLIHI